MTGILDLIQEINQKGMTIILVEHVLKAVVRVSKRIVVLQTGKKIAEGAPREVLVNEQVRRAYIGTDEKEAQS
jgi:branched-chain amino acid transport system ATP-binding protein